jgi:hypothetical protein
MSDQNSEDKVHLPSLARELGLEFYSIGRAVKPCVRKAVAGRRIAYFKPMSNRTKGKEGNVSYTVVNPESITRKCRTTCLRKYHAWLRKLRACNKVDKIVFEFGVSRKDMAELKREIRKFKYMK